ncbi:MAG: hypothetical protein HY319_15625 [Armatimonadetes bacterium]|nr:hypothetical protein [Armatimonadota bacterium]
MRVLGGASSWLARNIGSTSADYQPASSIVNGVREAGFGKVAVGAGIGAAVGGAAGFAWGLHNLGQDQVSVTTFRTELTRPVVVGADFDSGWPQMIPVGDTYMTIYHPDDWDPVIEQRAIGVHHDRQALQSDMGFGPVAGAVGGLVAGAVLGGLTGVVAGMVWRDEDGSREPRVPDREEKRRLARLADRAPLVGAAAGGVLGAAAGTWAGLASQARSQTLTQTLFEPVARRELIGWIPHNSDTKDLREFFHDGGTIFYHELGDRFGNPPFQGKEAVYAEVPTGELRGTLSTQTIHGLSPVTGAIGGAVVGAAGGFLAGVAAGVLMKTAAGEEPA